MNREDIIRMAREAEHLVIQDYYTNGPVRAFSEAQLERFAALVASAAQAKEREACAKIVEESSLPDAYSEPVLLDIADDIRARGQA